MQQNLNVILEGICLELFINYLKSKKSVDRKIQTEQFTILTNDSTRTYEHTNNLS